MSHLGRRHVVPALVALVTHALPPIVAPPARADVSVASYHWLEDGTPGVVELELRPTEGIVRATARVAAADDDGAAVALARAHLAERLRSLADEAGADGPDVVIRLLGERTSVVADRVSHPDRTNATPVHEVVVEAPLSGSGGLAELVYGARASLPATGRARGPAAPIRAALEVDPDAPLDRAERRWAEARLRGVLERAGRRAVDIPSASEGTDDATSPASEALAAAPGAPQRAPGAPRPGGAEAQPEVAARPARAERGTGASTWLLAGRIGIHFGERNGPLESYRTALEIELVDRNSGAVIAHVGGPTGAGGGPPDGTLGFGLDAESARLSSMSAAFDAVEPELLAALAPGAPPSHAVLVRLRGLARAADLDAIRDALADVPGVSLPTTARDRFDATLSLLHLGVEGSTLVVAAALDALPGVRVFRTRDRMIDVVAIRSGEALIDERGDGQAATDAASAPPAVPRTPAPPHAATAPAAPDVPRVASAPQPPDVPLVASAPQASAATSTPARRGHLGDEPTMPEAIPPDTAGRSDGHAPAPHDERSAAPDTAGAATGTDLAGSDDASAGGTAATPADHAAATPAGPARDLASDRSSTAAGTRTPTGVIVDARGTGYAFHVAPRVIDGETGEELYGLGIARWEEAPDHTLAAFASSPEELARWDRAGTDPLEVRAVGLGPGSADLVVGRADAERLRRLDAASTVLEAGRVVFLVDPVPTGGLP